MIILIVFSYESLAIVAVLFCLIGLFLYGRYQKLAFVFIIFLLFVIGNTLVRVPNTIPSKKEGVVVAVASNYYTVRVERQNILLYSKSFLNYGDKVSFEGNYERLFSPPSKSSFSFEKHMKHKNIIFRIKDDFVEVTKSKKTIRSFLLDRIVEHDDRHLLAKTILNINDHENDPDLIVFLLSSGIIMRTLIFAVLSILNKFMYEDTVFNFEILLYVITMLTFNQYTFFLYLIVRRFLSKTKIKQLDKLSVSIICILLMNPSYVFSLSFIITTLYAFVSYISLTSSKTIRNLVVIIPIQLVIFYECDIVQVLMFPLYRMYSCLAFVFSLVDVLFTTHYTKLLLSSVSLHIPSITITGKLSFMLIILWLAFALKLLQKFSFVYSLLLVGVLLLNQNQLLFNPFLTMTQLYIGQGDSAVVKYPFKREVLIIDTGSSFNWSKLKSHLNYYGVRTVHSLLITHDDEDHCGNKENLVNHYNVKRMIEQRGEYNFYNLQLDVQSYDTDDENDSSLITRFTVNDTTYLTLGDISKEIEHLYLKDNEGLKYNVVKIGHHGSNTSSSDALLNHENINLILNSSGYKNMYNHPHHAVMSRISKRQLPFIDTQLHGDIEIKHIFRYNYVSLSK